MRHYQVRDMMTAKPMTVTPATPLKNVAEILVRGRIGVVPVLTPHGRVAGVGVDVDVPIAVAEPPRLGVVHRRRVHRGGDGELDGVHQAPIHAAIAIQG